jgi:nucleoside triphosphate pyrophosphatase
MRNTRKIILASASPRRKEIFEKTCLKFEVDESDCDERAVTGLKPHELAKFLSRAKAKDVARRHRNALVIAADTIVLSGRTIFGKPGGEEQAREMLKTLSGKAHSVITGFAIIDTAGKKELSRSVETTVYVKRLGADEIEAYIKSGEPFGKAGAYGIQGLGAVIVEKIDGDFFNVMGLPLHTLAESLKKFGVHVLHQDKV